MSLLCGHDLLLQVFRRKKWKYLILDEAHMIKNWKSQRWQTLLRFNSKRRLLITGTPLQVGAPGCCFPGPSVLIVYATLVCLLVGLGSCTVLCCVSQLLVQATLPSAHTSAGQHILCTTHASYSVYACGSCRLCLISSLTRPTPDRPNPSPAQPLTRPTPHMPSHTSNT
jgi:hypothetical protein